MKKESPLKVKWNTNNKRDDSPKGDYPKDFDSFWEAKKEVMPDELPAFSQVQFLKPDFSQQAFTSSRQIEIPNSIHADSKDVEKKLLLSAQQYAEDSRQKAKLLISDQETRGPSRSFMLQLKVNNNSKGHDEEEEGASQTKTKQMSQKEPTNLALANLKLIAQTRKRVMYFFKNFTSSGRKSYLSNFQVRWTIDDKSDDTSLDSKQCFLLRFLDALKQRLLRATFQNHQYLGLMNPHGILSRLILVLITLFNTFFFLLFSIKIIYYGESEYDFMIHDSTAIIWIFETLSILNTKIYKGSNVISDRYLIAQNYLYKRAAFDAISITLFVSMPTEDVARVICQIISFIKLMNVLKDIEEVQKMICMSVKNYHFIRLINLILKIVVFGHVVACAWYLIGQLELKVLGYEATWYDDGLASDYIWWKLYLESVYWSLTLLTTGSNVAGTLVQMFFTTVIMLLTTIMFGYMLNVTGDIISEFGQKDSQKQQDLNKINEYMRQNKISKELQARVNLDIENYYASNLDSFKEDRSEIISKISPNLQNLLQQEYSSSILQNIVVVKDRFSSELIQELSSCLEEEYYLPDQVIFKEQQFNNLCLMYIIQGSVELCQSFLGDEKTEKTIQKLSQGSCLGQINFFTGQAHDKTARSKEFTKIVKINRDKFIEVARLRERDLQVFQELKDQLSVYENYGVIQEKCIFCQNSTHLEAECHLIHLQKDEIYQKLKFFENITQSRSNFLRNTVVYQEKSLSAFQEVIRVFRISLKERINAEGDETASNYSYKLQNTVFESQVTDEVEEEDEEDEEEIEIRKELQPFSTINEESLNASQRKDPQTVIGQVWTLKISHKKNESLEGDMDYYNPPIQTSPAQPQNEKPIDLNVMLRQEEIRIESLKQDNNLLNESFNKRKDLININSPSLAPRRITSASSAIEQIQQDGQFARQQSRRNSNQVRGMNHPHFQNTSGHFQSNNSNPHPTSSNLLPNSQSNFQNKRKISQQMIQAQTIVENNPFTTSAVLNDTSKHNLISITEWDFDKQQDYKYYFPKGNLKQILQKRAKKQKSRVKDKPKRKMNKTGLFSTVGYPNL